MKVCLPQLVRTIGRCKIIASASLKRIKTIVLRLMSNLKSISRTEIVAS